MDDKLKIIDDVPTSAVEMVVKEKVRELLIIKYDCLVQSALKSNFISVFEESPKARENC